jgi:calcineurin-like phosphoesterase family protein/2'-5' RNA ligase
MADTFPDTMFLVEIRLGRTKWRIKKITAAIVSMFRIQESVEKHPHITLFGPFSIKDGVSVQDVQKAVEGAARPFGSVPFLIHGYDTNQGLNGAVIAYRVIPTHRLADLTEAVARSVGRLAETFNTWDMDPDQKWFHVTIANRLERDSAATIYRHLETREPYAPPEPDGKSGFFGAVQRQFGTNRPDNHAVPPRPPLYDEDGLRITIVKGENILAEYDLEQHRWFSPESATAAMDWQQTLEQYRKKNEIELTYPRYKAKEDIFVISDLHLGHANIIRYCSRPFPHDAVEEMDRVLIKNWNYTVKPGQRIFHIGDLCYGPYAKNPSEYLQRLNGAISLIRGNHDEGVKTAVRKETLVHQGIPFLLVHDPDDVAETFSGWVIHGHHHNNNLEHYPFISFEERRVNVCAEVVRYQPVSLSDLCNIIKEHQLKPKIKTLLLRASERDTLS